MAYASIDPCMHDDEKFVQLDDAAQALWTYLLTGPEAAAGVPGLIIIGIAGLAEARRRSTQDIATALDRLRLAGMVEIDPLHRLIRVPKAPRYRAPGNANVVRGWYRRWTSLPNSQLKYAHVQSMREAITMADVADSTREVFEQTFGADLARRVAFRSGEVKPALQLVPSAPVMDAQPLQASLPLGGLTEVVVPPSGVSGNEIEEFSGIACSAVLGGNHSGTIPEWPYPERKRRSESGSVSDPVARDPAEPHAAPPAPLVAAESMPATDPAPEPESEHAQVKRLAHELRVERLARVQRLRSDGIGATLPEPSLHDEVAKGEPDRLVRAWMRAALQLDQDPEVFVRQRGRQVLDVLEVAARRDRSIAGMRETVCYSAKVVDWALTTEAASAANARRRGPRTTPVAVVAESPFVVPRDERRGAHEMLGESLAKLGIAPRDPVTLAAGGTA